MVGENKWLTKVVSIILLVLGAVFASAPVLWMLLSSFKPNNEIFSWPPTWIPKGFTLSAYVEIFNSPEKLRFFFNSYFVASIVVIITLIVGILAAYSFSRFEFPGKEILNTVIVSFQAVPPIVLLIPFMSLIVSFHLFDTYFALILTYLILTFPFAIIMLIGYFNTLSTNLDEAVMIDGGSRFRALWSVLVPIAVPGLVSVGMYTFMLSWNEYLFALALTQSSEVRTVPVGISLLMGQHTYDWGQMMAMSVLGSVPVAILFLFFQKYFIAGMSSGSIKE